MCSNFSGNAGSSVLLRLSVLSIRGEVTFRENVATTGGALNIREASKVRVGGGGKGEGGREGGKGEKSEAGRGEREKEGRVREGY